MTVRKERPRCRRELERIVTARGCSLQELLEHPHRLSDGMRIQARKMLEEERLKGDQPRSAAGTTRAGARCRGKKGRQGTA